MIIHDYFDGLANCVECGGPCKLDPQSIEVSNAIRYMSETIAKAGGKPGPLIRTALERVGVDFETYWARAESAARRWK